LRPESSALLDKEFNVNTESQDQQGWLAKNWVWFVPVGSIGLILLCVGSIFLLFLALFQGFKSSDVYQLALEKTRAHPEAVAALGEPIETGFFVTGSIENRGKAGDAELEIPVSGPRGSGTIHAVAVKVRGRWEFRTLELILQETGERVDLTSRPPDE
jgi:hypothetical protein